MKGREKEEERDMRGTTESRRGEDGLNCSKLLTSKHYNQPPAAIQAVVFSMGTRAAAIDDVRHQVFYSINAQ